MKKIENIQALRGIAVLLVLFFHLLPIEKKYGGSEVFLPNFLNYGNIGVDIFFVISGFIMITITRGKFQNTKNAVQFLYHRASRIYPTYWIYSLLVLGVFLLNPSIVNSSQGNEVNITASFLLFPSERLPLLMVGWTLIHEMYFYFVFFILLLLIPENKLIYALILWATSLVFINISFEFSTPLAKLIFHPLTIEFIFGCFMAIYFYHKNSIEYKIKLLFPIALTVLIASTYGIYLYDHTILNNPQEWRKLLFFGAPATAIVFFFINTERNGFLVNSLLAKIGDASYSIYLSHILTLSAAGRIWGKLSTNSLWDNYVMIPVLFALAIFVGVISYRYIEQPLLIYSRKFV